MVPPRWSRFYSPVVRRPQVSPRSAVRMQDGGVGRQAGRWGAGRSLDPGFRAPGQRPGVRFAHWSHVASFLLFFPDEKLYDAYVLYPKCPRESQRHDVDTLALKILPEVLENQCGYRLFIFGRDDFPGQGMFTNKNQEFQGRSPRTRVLNQDEWGYRTVGAVCRGPISSR